MAQGMWRDTTSGSALGVRARGAVGCLPRRDDQRRAPTIGANQFVCTTRPWARGAVLQLTAFVLGRALV